MANRVVYSFVALDKFSSVARQLKARLGEIRKEVTATAADARKSAAGFRKFAKGIQSAGVAISAFGTGLVAAGFGLVKQSARFEDARLQLEALSGSAEEGRALLEGFQQIPLGTTLEFEQLVPLAKRLSAVGVPADELVDTITRLGIVANGVQKPVEGIAQAFAFARQRGIIDPRVLKQLQKLGIDLVKPLREENPALTLKQIEKDAADGAIPFSFLVEQLKELTREGSKFHDQNLKAQESLKDIASDTSFTFSVAAGKIGDVLVKELDLKKRLAELADTVIRVVKGFENFAKANPSLVKLGLIAAGATVVLGPLLIAASTLGFTLVALAPIAAVLGVGVGALVGGFLAVGAAIAGVVAFGVVLMNNWQQILVFQDQLVADIKAGFQSMVDDAKSVAAQVASFFTTGAVGNVLKFAGGVLDVVGGAKSQTAIDLNISAPRGVVRETKTRTTGDSSGVDFQLNMQEGL